MKGGWGEGFIFFLNIKYFREIKLQIFGGFLTSKFQMLHDFELL